MTPQIKRQAFIRKLSVALFASVVANFAVMTDWVLAEKTRPNVVWLMSEDNSVHFMELFDPQGARTPNIASMAADGIVFERAFSNSPVCSVARTTLITGCYGPRIGTQFHRRGKLANLSPELKMFPAYLRAAGYYTTNNRKEDYNAIKTDDVWDDSSGKATYRNRPDRATPFFHVQTFTQSHESSLHFAAQALERKPTTHDPDQVQLFPYHPDTPLFRYTHALYLDKMRLIDDLVGKFVDQLESDGVLDDTIVFYFGDHGGTLPRSKGYLYEAGLHVPLVVRVPPKWQHLSPFPPGGRCSGFVEFVDFAPSVLQLAGVEIPKSIDGKPFLGAGIEADQLATRNETFSYSDRFDEKYELARALRSGDWKYHRFYQPFYPDALRNNYRFKMLAYQQWQHLFSQGDLNPVQSQFFMPKQAEALYDLRTDPHETRNLAGLPEHHATLEKMRQRLRSRQAELPDLSFIPEAELIADAMDAPFRYGQQHAKRIVRYNDVVDACLQPIDKAISMLTGHLMATDPLERMWALVACCSLGSQAESLLPLGKELLETDDHRTTRVQAALFVAIADDMDPLPHLVAELNATASDWEALHILNQIVFVQDHLRPGQRIDVRKLQLTIKPSPSGEVQRRLSYLQQ